MTTQQLETLRERIAMRDVPFDEMIESLEVALKDVAGAFKYGDWQYAQARAQYLADVLKTMERR